jgi:GTP-binding protein
MPTIAIIGRPNAGKSTLFNALIGERKAIESDVPGTTRDRVFGTVEGEKLDFLLVDTGGLTIDIEGDIEADMRRQAEESIAGADLIYFCIDIRSELTAEEWEIVEILRKRKPKHIPVFLIATKAEKPSAKDNAAELYGLGISEHEIFFTSAKEQYGLFQLTEATETALLKNGFQSKSEDAQDEHVARMCIVGRPNAGKSTLLNTLSGKDVSIVSPRAGTTRDTIDSIVHFEKESYLLIDTAGIRRKSKSNREQIERYSRMRSLASLGRSDIAILMIDATEGISHLDQTLGAEIVEAGLGVIVVFTKWDLVRENIRDEVDREIAEIKATRVKTDEELDEKREKEVSLRSSNIRKRFQRQAQSRFPFLHWAPVLFLSSLEKRGIGEIFSAAKNIMEQRTRKISTSELNNFLEQALNAHPPASRGNTRLKVKYAVQTGVNPPIFTFFANDPDAAHFSFRRYLENRLREVYGFWGTPIQIEIRKK